MNTTSDSLPSKVEETETQNEEEENEKATEGEDPSTAQQLAKLFGLGSDEEEGEEVKAMDSNIESPKVTKVMSELAVSSVGSADSVKMVESAEFDILPTRLEPPEGVDGENAMALPVEFRLGDPIVLPFPVAAVHHQTADVALLGPGEWMAIEQSLFDENKSNGFVKGAPYSKRVIRWRREENSGQLQSNSKLIEWDDGTFSLCIEGKCVDLGKESFVHGTELLCIDQQKCLQALHAVQSGLYTAAMPSDDSDEEEAVLQSPVHAIRKPKTKRVTMLSNPVKDREEKLKKIEEERRDRELIERRQRHINEKYTLPAFDHMEEEEEEEEENEETGKEYNRGGHQPRTKPSRRQPARSKKLRREDSEESFDEDEDQASEGVGLGGDFEEEIEEVEADDEGEEEEEEEDEEIAEQSGEESSHSTVESGSMNTDCNKRQNEELAANVPPQKKHKPNDVDEEEDEEVIDQKTTRRTIYLSQDEDSDDSKE